MSNTAPFSQIPFVENELYQTLSDRFLKVVSGVPEGHLAYVDGQKQVSYQELLTASKLLAKCLRDITSKGKNHKQHLIGLLLDPDWQEMQCLMGVAFAGHYYLVLDTTNNEAQNQKIIDSYPIRVLVTTAKYRNLSEKLTHDKSFCDTVFLDEFSGEGNDFEVQREDYKAFQSLCFSSGSTGQPRSVIRTHGAALISALTAAEKMGMNPSDRITLTSSIAIGMASTPSIGALMNGATIYRRLDAMISPNAFYEWLKTDQITIARASAGMLRSLTKIPSKLPPLEKLRLIDTGGESFTREEIDSLLKLMPSGGRFNVRLASNEAGNYALFTTKDRDHWDGERNPAGYAPPFIKVFIVDQNRDLVPPGEVGEIAVKSKFLAAGYFNDPEQTQARFIPDPNSDQEVTYYTGDMGRISSDGLIEFFGRKDFRVKVRGYTIELEAVDSALSNIEGIVAATSTVQELPSGNKRLIGYFVEQKDRIFSPSDLRQSLKSVLPNYMVPSVLVKLDSLPLTPSGKINRKALPLPPVTRPDLKVPFIEPLTDQEISIAHIWEKILDVSPVGMNDSFFELGGDSLLSMQMIMEVEQASGCTITEEFFKLPTINNLFKFINETDNFSEEVESTSDLEWGQKSTRTPSRKRKIKKLLLKVLEPNEFLYSFILRIRKPFVSKFLNMRYPEGINWLLKRVQNPFLRTLFYQRERRIFNKFILNLGMNHENDHDPFFQALAGSIWADTTPKLERKGGVRFQDSPKVFWRDLGTRINELQPDQKDKFFQVDGFHHLQDAYQRGRGVILLSYHGNMTKLPVVLIQKWLGLSSIPVISPRLGLRKELGTSQKDLHSENRTLSNPESQARFGANALLSGYRLLNEGQVVRVYIDNGISSRGTWPINVCGRQYMMRTGWSDLAYHTGASVIPTISALQKDGCIHMIFLPPFQLTDQDYDRQIHQFLTHYADFLTYAYKNFPWSLGWKIMQNHSNTPEINKKASK
jgi:acyl-coenzyme A synthetase/AMP-(fatty) acid ligase/acyl carrier protein/lauroyl/myristoyl acyltransferase